jgi:hypothetical protein
MKFGEDFTGSTCPNLFGMGMMRRYDPDSTQVDD